MCWIFTVAATGSCQFLAVEFKTGKQVGFGFFNYEEDIGGCSRIEDKDSLDAGLKAARTFAVFACLLMSAALVLALAVHLMLNKARDRLWLCLRIAIYCSFWCSLLTFLAFGTGMCDYEYVECKVGAVGILTIINILLLVGLNVLFIFVEAAPEPALKILKPSVVGTTTDRPASHQDVTPADLTKSPAGGHPGETPPEEDDVKYVMSWK